MVLFLGGIHHKSAPYYFMGLREIIANQLGCETAHIFEGEIEVDESYFGVSSKGKRGRRAAGKVPVFGLLKRFWKVYTQIIPDARQDTLVPIIFLEKKVKLDSVVYSDYWSAYNKLDISGFRHFRLNHSKLFAKSKNHINGIENFWNQAKRHWRKFNGIAKENFPLFFKECEWRFNHSDPKTQLNQLRQWIRGILI